MVSVGDDTVPNNTVCPADDAGVAVPFTITVLPNVSEPVKVRFPENFQQGGVQLAMPHQLAATRRQSCGPDGPSETHARGMAPHAHA